MTDDKLTELLKLAKAAGRGPGSEWFSKKTLSPIFCECFDGIDEARADAAFIAACDPDTVIALVERMRRLDEE